jgi:arylsulfatase
MNVILYVLDSLRADHVSTYGYDRPTTPVIDSLGENGVVFEQCIAPSTWTRPVAASLMTGLYPPVHGNRGLEDGLNPPYPTFPEYLQQEGFDTMAMGVMANIQGNWGFDGGFDQYVDLSEDDGFKQMSEMEDTSLTLTRADDITNGFIDWLDDRESDDPFFSMMWSYETHTPLKPPAEYRRYVQSDYDGPVDGSPGSFGDISTDADREQLIGLYDGSVRYNDACIGDICEALEERDELKDTLFICIGDHGEGLGEHPGFYGHGVTPYEELIHVPCVVQTPNDVSGHRVSAQISLLDLYPTILETVGIEDRHIPGEIQGESVATALHGEGIEGSEQVFVDGKTYESKDQYVAVRTPEWKFIDVESPTGSPSGYLQMIDALIRGGRLTDVLRNPLFYYRRHFDSASGYLFDLSDDPAEETNLVGEAVDFEAEYRGRLEDWMDACQSLKERLDAGADRIELDEKTEEKLSQLGYIE